MRTSRQRLGSADGGTLRAAGRRRRGRGCPDQQGARNPRDRDRLEGVLRDLIDCRQLLDRAMKDGASSAGTEARFRTRTGAMSVMPRLARRRDRS
jgi:hypothetical protein